MLPGVAVHEQGLQPRYVPGETASPLINPSLSFQDKTKTTLTMEDLSAALSEYNINAKKPEFFM